jgi:hypothetical protein
VLSQPKVNLFFQIIADYCRLLKGKATLLYGRFLGLRSWHLFEIHHLEIVRHKLTLCLRQ